MFTKKYWIIAVLSALILVTLWSVFKDYKPGPQEGNKAPDFVLSNLQNEKKTLNSFHGKLILLNFWASWCGPCLEEMDSLDKLYQKLKNKNFEVVAVSLDEEGWEAIDSFLKKTPVTFPILLDENFSVAQSYGTYRVPESFLINTKGEIVEKIIGPQNWMDDKVVKKIESFLQSKDL